MKKLAILAAAAIGFVIAEKVGRKQESVFTDPDSFRPEAPVTEPVAFTPPVAVVPEPEPVDEAPVADADSADESAVEPVAEAIDEPEVEPVAEPELADDQGDEIEASLSAEPEVELLVEQFEEPAAETPEVAELEEIAEVAELEQDTELEEVAEAADLEADADSEATDLEATDLEADAFEAPAAETPATELDAPVEPAADIPPASKEMLETWESNWGNDMPFVETPAPETIAEPLIEPIVEPVAEPLAPYVPTPAPKLAEIADDIVAKAQTAADLARADEPAVESSEWAETEDGASEVGEELRTEVEFVVPTAEDFADEVFTEDFTEKRKTDRAAIDDSDLAETGLMDSITDEELGTN